MATSDREIAAFADSLRRNTDAPHPHESAAERTARNRLAVYARASMECIKVQMSRYITGEIDKAEALANVQAWVERNEPR